MFQPKKHLLSLAVLAVLAGCGGGGSGPVAETPVIKPAAVSGKLIDGYISGATVFCDVNGNGSRDAGEEAATTNSVGGFTLTGGCSAAMVGSGGIDVDTGYAFRGQLKAPPGSAVITPLTTLLASSTLTHDQLAQVLSLPAGVDIRTVDIADGRNQDLRKKTLAVQLVIDNLANVVAEKTGRTDLAAVYASVAADIGAVLARSGGTPFVSPSGTVSDTLLAAVVQQMPTISKLALPQAELDTAINVLAARAQAFVAASDADLGQLTRALQDPVAPSIDAYATKNYVALVGDGFRINDHPVGIDAFRQGKVVSGLASVGFELATTGSPAAETTSSVALELIEEGGEGRKLQLLLDQIVLKFDANQRLSLTVPAGAKVHAYGHTANGTDINLKLTDLTFQPIVVVDNGFRLNYTNIVQKVLASVDNTTKTTAEKFTAIRGTFAVKVVMSKLNLRHTDGTAIASQTIALTNTPQSVTGAGLVGRLTID